MLPNTVIQEDDGRTALHEAATIGDEKTLQTLLNAGANRNAKDRKHANTPLHEAAWRGFSRSVKLLCSLPPLPKSVKQKNGVNESRGALHSTLLGTRNGGGFSALHLASQNGHNQSCREILLAGADPDVQNNYGDTPLHTACRYGHAGATRILISAKCDPNRTNLNGDTALHIACAMGRRKLTRILLEAGANPDIKNAQNETPNDIAFRKKLTEIIEILSSPIEVKHVKTERDRSSSNSKSNKDRTDGKSICPDKSKNQRSDLVANPVNWSPYGCHYFPDPRSFPAPKLDTLPKEPLNAGEQYFLDLAGNIRKGPVGVGNTCYCGPFFRHIEERISKNRKSLKKYVHKATERLDNKVQALALKTDDQIEQLTKSMLADRIRCDGRRLHLEQWLKRGDPHRLTTGGHHSKSRKNAENANTLTRCKSLELLGEHQENFSKMPNSKSVEILDETQIIIHRDADHQQSNENIHNSLINNRKMNQNSSERSRSSGDRMESGHLFSKTGPQNVSQRLEQLLAKTNEILEMEKKARRRNKEALIPVGPNIVNSSKKKVGKNCTSLYNPDITEKLKHLNLNNPSQNSQIKYPNLNNSNKNQEYIENAMKKITSSLANETDEAMKFGDGTSKSFSPDVDIKDFPISQKELDRKCDQEHEKSSILSSSSHKNPSSIGSGYIPDFSQTYNNQLRVSRNSKSGTSDNSHSSKLTATQATHEPNTDILENPIIKPKEGGDVANRKFKNLISALKKDYHSTKDAIESQIRAQSIENASSEEEDEDEDELSIDHYENEELHNLESCSEDDGDVDGSDYRHRDHFYNPNELSEIDSKALNLGFFKNDSFQDVICQPIDSVSSENQHRTTQFGLADETSPESTKTNQLNEFKKRLSSGSNWKSQMLRKTQQILNLNGFGNENVNEDPKNSTNGIVKKIEIRNSEIKTLKPNPTGALKRSKVQELVAKIQGKDSQYIAESQKNGHTDENDENFETDHIYQRLPSAYNSSEKKDNPNFKSDYNCGKPHFQEQAQQNSTQHFVHLQSNFENNLRMSNSGEFNYNPRTIIPKDAYFHELPNKNHLRPICDKLPEKQLLNFSSNSPRTAAINDNYIHNVSPTLLASRTRNPLPYNMTTGDYSNISQIGQDLCIEKSSYRNYTNLLPTERTINPIVTHIHQHKQNMAIPMPAVRHFINHQHNQQPDKLIGIKKFVLSSPSFDCDYNPNSNYGQTHSSEQHLQSQAKQHQHLSVSTDIITPEQAQFERDLSNDSGFSTKIGGSSLGPSPSLSGNNDYSIIQRNGSTSILHNHSNVALINNKTNNSNLDGTNNIQCYIGNTSSLV
ncbi:uncharacterized protein LOC129613327 [Condylostylus longicornis]|uniref:uncharacterized protein LOC129613327 n=1 Tax=Condylostylus longicornis TaxID=2530218 RepID=UPI00244E5B13|nr:uncharacterized protein LOC129613327 [Condylostylus longicornis]